MKKYLFLSLIILFSTSGLLSQSLTTLSEAIQQLQASLQEEVKAKSTYEQRIEWKESIPHKITFHQNVTGRRNSEQFSYELSLKDIDANTISVKTSRDLIILNVFIKNKQNLIKTFKDGEQDDYENEFTIMAIDNDNGKAIRDALKQAVKLAKEIKSSCSFETFENRIQWLEDNVTTFSVNDVSYEQSFQQVNKNTTIIDYKLTKEEEEEEIWQFNLADLDDRRIEMNIKGTEISIEIPTKGKLKYISYQKASKQENYASSFKIYIDDFDRAKCLLSTLEAVINDSKKSEKGSYPPLSSLTDALDLVASNVQDLQTEKEEIDQNLTKSCLTQLTQLRKESNGDQTEKVFKFNLTDIQPNSVEINVKGKEIFLEMNTGKTKLVQPLKNGEIENYTNKLEMQIGNIENAKMLAYAMPKAIASCKEKNAFAPPSDAKAAIKWINDHLAKINEGEEIEQSLKSIDGNDCKWQFTSAESGGKEEIFEFSLEDIDAKAIDFDISGKELSIEINTRHKEKIIKYYKDGEPDNYQSSFSIRLQDIEDARNMMVVIKEIIRTCNK